MLVLVAFKVPQEVQGETIQWVSKEVRRATWKEIWINKDLFHAMYRQELVFMLINEKEHAWSSTYFLHFSTFLFFFFFSFRTAEVATVKKKSELFYNNLWLWDISYPQLRPVPCPRGFGLLAHIWKTFVRHFWKMLFTCTVPPYSKVRMNCCNSNPPSRIIL